MEQLSLVGAAVAIIALASAGVWWRRHRLEVWQNLRDWASSAGFAGQE